MHNPYLSTPKGFDNGAYAAASASQGSQLDVHNRELMKRVEGLKSKRDELSKQITEEDAERSKYEEHFTVIQKRMKQLTESLDYKLELREQYDKIIEDTEAAYVKILDSSKSLLQVLDQESRSLGSRKPLG